MLDTPSGEAFPFTHSFSKYLSDTCEMTDTVLNMGWM